jgi:hypothetical protein
MRMQQCGREMSRRAHFPMSLCSSIRLAANRSRCNAGRCKPLEYVIGAVHTNMIEGFWSVFKRGGVGALHKMSAKYIPLYVAEFQFRYTNHFNYDIFGTAIGGC